MSKKPTSEILFRTKFDLGISNCSEILLRRKDVTFIVELNNIHGKYACQNDSFYDIEEAYNFYNNILEQLQDYIIPEKEINNASKNR